MATLWVKLVCVWACCWGCRSSKEYCSLMLDRMMRRVMRLSEAELLRRSKFLFMRYCLKAVWMVLAALRLTKEPPYFLSSISTWWWTQLCFHTLNDKHLWTSTRVEISQFFSPSYPADLSRAHSCLRGLCISCSPLPLACGAPSLLAGGVSAVPKPSWPSWRQQRTEGLWTRRRRCCCRQCSALSRAGTASARMSAPCGRPSLDTGALPPHWERERERKLLEWVIKTWQTVTQSTLKCVFYKLKME